MSKKLKTVGSLRGEKERRAVLRKDYIVVFKTLHYAPTEVYVWFVSAYVNYHVAIKNVTAAPAQT